MNNGRNSKKQSNKTYVGIVGSRNFTDKKYFLKMVKQFIPVSLDSKTDDVVVVSGGAKGTDTLAEQFTIKFYTEEPWIFEPEQEIIKKEGFATAAHARNQEIVNAADYIIAFWDGKSRGTRDTINRAAKAKKPTIIIWV
jgi:hypothetical protein